MTRNLYQQALLNLPAPGKGCHPALLGVANLGLLAGVSPENILDDIFNAIPHGNRRVPMREVSDAVKKACQDFGQGTFRNFAPRTARPKPIVRDGKAVLQSLIRQAPITDGADLWEASPIRLMDDVEKDPSLFLSTLFQNDDLIFIGERHEPGILGRNIRPVSEWVIFFKSGGKPAPHFIINPLSGEPAPTKGGDKQTFRGDLCVKNFRYSLAEFDSISHEDQIAFWCAVQLPVRALIDSGGKSIHGLLDVQKLAVVTSQEAWDDVIRNKLFGHLKPLGVDPACSNPARLSRLPGYRRGESFQRILWLSSEGKPIC